MSNRQYKQEADKFEKELLASLPPLSECADGADDEAHKEKMYDIFNSTKQVHRKNIMKISLVVVAAAVLAVSVCMCFSAIRDPIINTVVSAISPAQQNEDETQNLQEDNVSDATEQPKEEQQAEEVPQEAPDESKTETPKNEETKSEQPAENSNAIKTGKWGDNITYKINEETGVMELNGNGKIADLNGFSTDGYDEFDAPAVSNYDPNGVDNYTTENLGTSEKPYGKVYLNKIIIGEGITEIGKHAFNGVAVSEVLLPSTLTKICYGAFYHCTNLKSITIPSSTKTIDEYAFSSCRSLSSVTISEGVKKIEKDAFSACTSLTEVYLPSTIDYVASQAFIHCTGLQKFTVSNGCFFYRAVDGILYADGGGKLLSCPENYQKSTVTIPDGTNGIGYGAFYRCKNIKKIIAPAEMMYLTDYAFYECPLLQSIQLPNKVTKGSDSRLIYCCESLEKVNFPYNTTSVLSDFRASLKLQTVVIPATVTEIQDYTFHNNHNVTIYCHKNSYAHSYAVEHGLKYSLLD